MSVAVDSLWPSDIKPTILSPRTILEGQAQALTKKTNGLLVGDLRVSHDEEKNRTYLSLDVVVPALNNYRHRILTATHARETIYPTRIDADYFKPSPNEMVSSQMTPVLNALNKRPRDREENEAASDEEFRTLVGHVLQSHLVKAALVSLIARANEILSARDRQDQGETTPSGGESPEVSPES
jgi:hypothetical protein